MSGGENGSYFTFGIFRKEGRQKDSLKESIINLNLKAAQQFSRNLASPAGTAARKYLQNRGIAEEVIKQFRLDMCPTLGVL